MTPISTSKSLFPLMGICLCLLACSYSSKRDNPLDPELTPPVELEVALDDTAGTTTLTWNLYEGETPFAAYWVLRGLQASDVVDTLVKVTDPGSTTYIDSTAETGLFYSYRVSVVNEAGLEVTSTAQTARSPNHPGVEIRELEFNSTTASASLTWSPYSGARFKTYRLLRRADELVSEIVAEITDVATTSFVDTGLVGNTEYRYQVVVVTDLEDGEYVRLYEEEDRILALISGEDRVQLLSFAASGQLLEEQVLLENPGMGIPPHTVALTFLPDGTRLLGLLTKPNPGLASRMSQLLAYDAGWSPLLREISLEHDFESFGSSAAEVEGQIVFAAGSNAIDNVRFSSNGRLLIDDEFDTPDVGEWEVTQAGRNEARADVEDGALLLSINTRVRRKITASWHDMRLEADVTNRGSGRSVVVVKADTLPARWSGTQTRLTEHTSLTAFMLYEGASQSATLHILPPLDSGLEGRVFTSHFAAAIGPTYRFRFAIDDGHVEAAIGTASWWPSEPRPFLQEPYGLVSLISVDESWAFAVGDSLIRMAPGRPDVALALEAPVSEMRVWEEAAAEPQLGICVPDQNQVLIAPAQVSRIGYLDWPFVEEGAATVVGTEAGQGPGALFFPLSFDVAADGRIFVLDAGNRRIQAFDSTGNYITQWGDPGTADGRFDFGGGHTAVEFVGSITVDDEGFIYVADVGNKRIQKFAP